MVTQQIIHSCQFRAQERGIEFDVYLRAVEVLQFGVVCRQNPSALGADGGDGLLQWRDETAFIFQTFSQGENGNATIAGTSDGLIVCAVAVAGKFQIEGIW